jgi:hypothetical protein
MYTEGHKKSNNQSKNNIFSNLIKIFSAKLLNLIKKNKKQEEIKEEILISPKLINFYLDNLKILKENFLNIEFSSDIELYKVIENEIIINDNTIV